MRAGSARSMDLTWFVLKLREDDAVEHDAPLAPRRHAAEHRRGVWHPTRAGRFALSEKRELIALTGCGCRDR